MLGRVADERVELLLQVVQPGIRLVAAECAAAVLIGGFRGTLEALVGVALDQGTTAFQVALLRVEVVQTRLRLEQGTSDLRSVVGQVPGDGATHFSVATSMLFRKEYTVRCRYDFVYLQ